MSGSYRSEFVALVAVACTVVIFLIGLGAGAHYNESQQQQGAQSNRPNLHFLEGSPEGYQAICDSPKDQPQADLCQQWRSAQAATDSAKWALGQFILGVVGIGGIVGTIFYARHTLIENRRIGQAQVRAYLMLEQTSIEWGEIVSTNSQHTALFSTRWENRGNSPALACNLSTRVYPIRVEDIGMPIPEADDRFEKLDFGHTDISVGGDGAWSPAPQPINEKQAKDWIAGKMAVVVHSCVMYRDVFGKQVRIQACSQAHYLKRDEGKSRVQFSTYPHHNRYEI